MSIDIEARLRAANPLPQDEQVEQLYSKDLPHLLASDIQAKKEGRMSDTTDRHQRAPREGSPLTDEDQISVFVPDRRRPSRRLRPAMAVAAFLIMVAIGIAGVAALVTSDGPDLAAAPAGPLSAEEVATSFVEAFGAFDVETAITHLAADADIKGIVEAAGVPVTGTLDELRRFNSWFESMSYQQLLHPQSCEETGTSASGTSLRCAFNYHLLGSEEFGLGPYTGSSFNLIVRDGAIVRAAMLFVFDEFSPQRWEPFAAWVSTTYPEDAQVMYVDGTYSGAQLTEESIQLWQLHSQEYAQAEIADMVNIAESFVAAYASFDMDRAFSYLAADAILPWPGVEEGVRLYSRLNEAHGFKYILDPCEVVSSSALGTSVRCDFDYHAIRSDEIGLGPFTGSSFDLIVREGEIFRASVELEYISSGFSTQMWEPFALWVSETYPDDAAIMYTDSTLTLERLTEESIQLWELRTREYVERVG